MIDYQDFSAKFINENKILKKYIGISLLINSMILLIVLFQKQYFIYQGGALYKEKPLLQDVCLSAFTGIINDKPNKHEVTNEILKILEKEAFTLKLETVYQVIALSESTCKILIKANGRLQSFKIKMVSNDLYPLGFKLSEIIELTPRKEDL